MSIDWKSILDPGERLDFVASFARLPSDPDSVLPLLEDGETIASYTLAPTAEAVALGLMVMDAPPFAPEIINSGTAIRLWLSVAAGMQGASAFKTGAAPGPKLGVTANIVTTSTPPRIRERTWSVEVKQL